MPGAPYQALSVCGRGLAALCGHPWALAEVRPRVLRSRILKLFGVSAPWEHHHQPVRGGEGERLEEGVGWGWVGWKDSPLHGRGS